MAQPRGRPPRGYHVPEQTTANPDPSSEARKRIEAVIAGRSLSPRFQPIVDLTNGRVAGHEALIRPSAESGFRGPDDLLTAAEQAGLFAELENTIRSVIFERAAELTADTLLFVNNTPETFAKPDFVQRITDQVQRCGMRPSRVVLEITERASVSDDDILATRSETLSRRGFHVAIDDVGAGTSGLNRIMRLRPGWLKLDRELVARVDCDPVRENLVRFMVHFARLSGVRVVAEGIERHAELERLIDLGIGFGQGYLLAKPAEAPGDIPSEIADAILTRASDCSAVREASPGGGIVDLIRRSAVCTGEDRCRDVVPTLDKDARLTGVVVTEAGLPVAWADRETLLSQTGQGDRTVAELAGPLRGSLDPGVSVSDALQIAAAVAEDGATTPLIIHDRNGVLGVVFVRELIRFAASRLHADRSPAGLTGLPGRTDAERAVAAIMRRPEPPVLDAAFIDLHKFFDFNDRHGFEQGDALLRALVTAVRETLIDVIDADDFLLAHLGDDRLFVLAPHGELVARANAIVAAYGRLSATEHHSSPHRVQARVLVTAGATSRFDSAQALFHTERSLRLTCEDAMREDPHAPGWVVVRDPQSQHRRAA